MSTEAPSLAQALSLIPDFRQAQCRRYDLLPMLLLSCVAVLCNCRSESAIAERGHNYGSKWLRKLGFRRSLGLSQSTLHRIFKRLNHLLLESTLSNWAQAVLSLWPVSSAEQFQARSMDGKTLCGSCKQGAGGDQHGSQTHQWELQASTPLEGYSKWPGLRQVLKLERVVSNKRTGEVRRETSYATTSPGYEQASAEELIGMLRGHWHTENRLPWVRDATSDEGRSQVRAGHIARRMAAFRDSATSLMRLPGANNIAAACRRYAAQPALASAAVDFNR